MYVVSVTLQVSKDPKFQITLAVLSLITLTEYINNHELLKTEYIKKTHGSSFVASIQNQS